MLRGHDGHVSCANFSPDGKQIVSVSDYDQTVRIWSGEKFQHSIVIQGHTKPFVSAHFSSDGRQIVTTARDKTIQVLYGKKFEKSIVLHVHNDWILNAIFSPDGNAIISTHLDTVRVWRGVEFQQCIMLEGYWGDVPNTEGSAGYLPRMIPELLHQWSQAHEL